MPETPFLKSDKFKRFTKWFSLILFGFIILVIWLAPDSPSKRDEFQKIAREQFDVVQAAWDETGELDSITCEPEDCTSTIYFNFNREPQEDIGLEGIMRSNAAVFSNLKLKTMGTSHVLFVARIDGKDVLFCKASKGKVDECK